MKVKKMTTEIIDFKFEPTEKEYNRINFKNTNTRVKYLTEIIETNIKEHKKNIENDIKLYEISNEEEKKSIKKRLNLSLEYLIGLTIIKDGLNNKSFEEKNIIYKMHTVVKQYFEENEKEPKDTNFSFDEIIKIFNIIKNKDHNEKEYNEFIKKHNIHFFIDKAEYHHLLHDYGFIYELYPCYQTRPKVIYVEQPKYNQ